MMAGNFPDHVDPLCAPIRNMEWNNAYEDLSYALIMIDPGVIIGKVTPVALLLGLKRVR